MSRKTLLLSIRPGYAKRILDGTKGIELRRIRPKVSAGDLVMVYASSPVKALIGTFEVAGIVCDSPARLWRQVRLTAGLTREQFDEYYAGASTGFGIVCSNPRCLKEPVQLEQLRRLWQNFCPPQVYRYVTNDELQQIRHVTSSNRAELLDQLPWTSD